MRNVLINISPKSTQDESAGHWHWAHITFLNLSKPYFHFVENISSRHQKDALGTDILSGLYAETRVSLSTVKNDASAISKTFGKYLNDQIIFHIYEGSFDSVILLCRLLDFFPNSVAVVNLHWADQVYSFTSYKVASKSLSNLLKAYESRLYLVVESDHLARHLSQNGLGEIFAYPVFSVHNKLKSDKDCLFDLLATPDDIPELATFIEATLEFEKETGVRLKSAISIPRHLVPWPFSDNLISILESAGYKVFTGGLRSRDYLQLIADSKVQVLLYSSQFYKWGSSGRLLDGLQVKTKSIVPSNTALSEFVKKNNAGWSFELNSPDSLISLFRNIFLNNNENHEYHGNHLQVEDCVTWVKSFIVSHEKKKNTTKPSLKLFRQFLFSLVLDTRQLKMWLRRNSIQKRIYEDIKNQELERVNSINKILRMFT